MNWATVVVSVLISTGIFGIVGFYLQKRIENKFDRKLTERRDKQAADRELLSRLLTELPSQGHIISYLKSAPSGMPVLISLVEDMESFCNSWSNPENRFLDDDIEANQGILIIAMRDYIDFSVNNLVARDWAPDYAAVPNELKKYHDRYIAVMENIESLANAIITAHEGLIMTARSKLSC